MLSCHSVLQFQVPFLDPARLPAGNPKQPGQNPWEHARIYVFGRGDQAKYFIASADLMTRNLQRRVEIACPIWDREIQEQLRYILDLQLQDNAKASFLQPSGAYLRKEIRTVRVDSQEELMRVSLHRPEQAPTVSEKPSALHRLLGRLFGKDSP